MICFQSQIFLILQYAYKLLAYDVCGEKVDVVEELLPKQVKCSMRMHNCN